MFIKNIAHSLQASLRNLFQMVNNALHSDSCNRDQVVHAANWIKPSSQQSYRFICLLFRNLNMLNNTT